MVFAPADVTDESAVTAALDAAAALGTLRLAVTCAGIATPGRVVGRKGPLPLATFRQVIEVNLIGTFNVLRLAAERMSANEPSADGDRGVVVMTASIAAYDGQVGQAAYAASKGGIVGLTLTAARDLADKAIRVVTIAPGTMETPMLAGLPEETRKVLEQQVPHPSRLGRPDEYAALVDHIATTSSSTARSSASTAPSACPRASPHPFASLRRRVVTIRPLCWGRSEAVPCRSGE